MGLIFNMGSAVLVQTSVDRRTSNYPKCDNTHIDVLRRYANEIIDFLQDTRAIILMY